MSPAASCRDGGEAEAVKSLPVFALGADEAITRGLRRAGLKTIGDVASRARHEITARFGDGFTSLLEQALGQGDAPISPLKPLPDYIVEKRFAEPVATEGVISATLSRLAAMLVGGDGPPGQGRAAAGGPVLPHRRRGARDCGRYRATRDQARGDRPAVSRAARCPEPIRSIPVSASISFACPPAASRSWCSSSAISMPMCTTMTSWLP